MYDSPPIIPSYLSVDTNATGKAGILFCFPRFRKLYQAGLRKACSSFIFDLFVYTEVTRVFELYGTFSILIIKGILRLSYGMLKVNHPIFEKQCY